MLPVRDFDGIPGISLGETLGQGGFGAVYRAHHHALDVAVAVKLIDASALDATGLQKSLREAQLMARLDHPNLLRIFDAGQTTRAVYLILELMDGGSCKDMRNISAERAVAMAKQLLSGLQSLHDARILHRDIKPANCLYRSHDARVKLADLGIAADWATVGSNYEWGGTVPFMAPELFEQPPRYSPASDIYALGVTLSCLLMSEDPFPKGSFDLLRNWALYGPRPQLASYRPDLPRPLTSLIDRMMARLPEDRPRDAAEALATLSGIEISAPVNPPPAEEISLASTKTFPETAFPETSVSANRVGAWELGEINFSSSNWKGYAVTHIHTGKASRLMHLQPSGPISGQTDFILAAAERAAAFAHPNLVQVIDWGLHEKTAYVVTAAQGLTLEQLVANGGPLEEHTAIRFMAALADALSYLHETGFVYQLIDPGATMVGSDARTSLLGWPVFCVPAGATVLDANGRSQQFLVKAYAAPEVLSRTPQTIEPSGDLYGMGATFCSLLVGKEVYFAARRNNTLPDIRQHAPDVTAPFARLINRLTSANPDERPTATQLKSELVRIGTHLGISLDEGFAGSP